MRRPAIALLAAILLAACTGYTSSRPEASVGAAVSKTIVAVSTTAPGATPTVAPSPSPSPTPTLAPTPTPYPGRPNRITTNCKPEPAPVTDAQVWLAAQLPPKEYCWAYWIINYESSWRVDLQQNGGACGLPQAWYCNKMSECAGYLNSERWPGCVPVPDWRTNWRGQLEWMIWWLTVAMAPDADHPSWSEGGRRYGSFAEVACAEFGCRTSDGRLVQGQGYY